MRKLLRRFLAPYRAKIIFGISCKIVEVIFDLVTPLIVASMIDVGVGGRDTSYVIRSGLPLVLFAAVGYSFTLICQKMAALVAQGAGTDMRNALMDKVMFFSAAEMDRFGAPSLVTRTTNDVNQVQVAIAMGIRQLIRFPFIALGSVIAACLIDLKLGVVFLVCVPAITAVFSFVTSRSIPFFRSMQEKLDQVSNITREALSGVRVIRAFRREQCEEARFDKASDELTSIAIDVGRYSALLSPMTFLVMNLGIVAILWSGALRIDVGGLSQGQVMAFVNYMSQTLIAIVYVANLAILFNRGTASGQRILEVLETTPTVTDEENMPLLLAKDAPALELNNVSFSYEGASLPSLEGVSLTLLQGQTLGIIGGTGSGKSTLAKLLPRLYDASRGEVKVLGHDVRDYPFEQLRSLVSLVPQKASLVTGTIRSNLTWRDPTAADEDLWKALDLAQASEFVSKKTGLLDEPVEAGGKNFSGGQRQRLTIARALVKTPALIVLDDSASALDFKTDARLRRALHGLRGSMTSVIISQRVSAVMQADLILVLDHGSMVGLGSHQDLLKTCPLYQEICLSQLSPEELSA